MAALGSCLAWGSAAREARAAPGAPASATAVEYQVAATVDRDRARIDIRGHVAFVDSRPQEVPLWLYPERTRQPPPSLSDLTFDRLYPYGVSRGGFARLWVRVRGCAPQALDSSSPADAVRGRLMRVSVCASAEDPVVVDFEGELQLPRRFGTLGATADALVLGDPWYPVVMSADGVPVRGDHRIDLRWDRGLVVAADGAHAGASAHIEQTRASHAPIAIVDDAHVREEVFSGVRVTLVTHGDMTRAEPQRLEPDGLELRDPWQSDPTGATVLVTRRAIGFLRRLGFTAFERDDPRRMAGHLVIVEAPERERLAVTLPGMLVVSDRAFRIFPLERIQRFHELAIARRIFTALLAPRVEATEPLGDRAWIADLDGSVLVDAMLAAEDTTRDRPQDLIGFAGFHPAVDQLLYAPKVAFRSAYFHDIEERDPDRDGADRAFNDRPFGHLVLEKLRDRIGPAIAPALQEHVVRGAPLRAAVASATPRSLDRFFRTWLGPMPKLAYRIVASHSEREGAGYKHRVELERLGATWVEEPVVVALVDADGNRAEKVWDQAGGRGVVEWSSSARLADATLDPEGRLVQDPALSDNHPRFDDEIRHTWRPPIFSSLALALSVSERRPDATIAFSLKRRYDVRQSFGASAASTARGISGAVRYTRGLGAMRDLNSTYAALTTSVYGLRSQNGFGGSPTPVTELDVAASYSWDSRIDYYNPRHGAAWGVTVAGGGAREDHGAVRPSASVAVRGEAVHALHPRHVLVGAVGGGATVCPALAQQLQALSGRSTMRAYAADELIGCADAYAIGEYRFLAVSGLYWNGAQLAWLKGLELVPFAAGGLLSSRDDAILRRFYGEVGGGVRAFVDWGGVQPGLVAIDLGIPLSRSSATYTDADGLVRRRPPFGLYVAFEQPL